MLKNKGGFTLIELVMVIVILGILAAVAIPRFVDLQSDARKAAIDGLAGNVRSTASMVYAKALVENKASAASGQVVTLEGTGINLVYGYPAADYIDDAMSSIDGFSFASGTPSSTFNKTGFTNDCSVGYTQPSAVNNPPTYNVVKTCS